MQTLSIRTAIPKTGSALVDALAEFQAKPTRDEQGRFFVSVELADQQQVLRAFDAIRRVVSAHDEDCVISCLTFDAELEFPTPTDAARCAAPLWT